MKNKWLNKEYIGYDDLLITDIGVVNTTDLEVFDMTEEQLERFREIMSDLREGGHRCIRVFRDAIMVDSDIYNICLSCGDIRLNGKIYSFKSDGLKKLEELKEEILNTQSK